MYPLFQEQIDYIGYKAICNVPIKNWNKICLTANILANADGCWVESCYWRDEQDKPNKFHSNSLEEIGEEEDILNTFDYIRDAMTVLESEVGAWFTATINILSDKSFNIEFDYEKPPNLLEDAKDEDFLDDWGRYPRTREYTPDWLITILERNGIKIAGEKPKTTTKEAPQKRKEEDLQVSLIKETPTILLSKQEIISLDYNFPHKNEVQIRRRNELKGFDDKVSPELWVMTTGTMQLAFKTVPSKGFIATTFSKQLANYIGCGVTVNSSE